METKKTIYTKLLEFQKLGISVEKDGKNDFFKKEGKPSKYTTLNEVLDKVKKPLNDLGVLIIFTPEETGLRTTLLDVESDTKVESVMKYLGVDNAQKLLACNTYFRRGSLVALLGLEDEDDDGNKASETKKAPPVPTDPIKAWKDKLATLTTKEEISAFVTKVLNNDKMLQQHKDQLQEMATAKYKTIN